MSDLNRSAKIKNPVREAPHVLLDRVSDRESFMEFLYSLVDDRRLAEKEEKADPAVAQWGAARGWQNTSITSFLEAAALTFEDGRYKGSAEHPSWRELAEFLYLGKIYE
jgi:hypothetical protein